MTYRSEIWISDFNIKLDNIHVFAFWIIELEENNDSKYDLLQSAFEEGKQLFNRNNTS